jgi:hypothetical protein
VTYSTKHDGGGSAFRRSSGWAKWKMACGVLEVSRYDEVAGMEMCSESSSSSTGGDGQLGRWSWRRLHRSPAAAV